MKTTKVFIGLSAIISVLLFSFGFYDGGVYFIFVTACIFILNSAFKKNAQLTSKLTDAEEKLVEIEDELYHSVSAVKIQFQEIKNLKTELEFAKANSYKEVERKRCREKYNRLYKGKKKAKVYTEQKSEPEKIEPFRMLVNPKQSAIVQQILFDNGYEWKSGVKEIFNTYYKALSFEDNKITIYDLYPHTDSLYFKDTHLPKLSFKKFMQLYGAKEQPYQINK